jgi:hypothetical protein
MLLSLHGQAGEGLSFASKVSDGLAARLAGCPPFGKAPNKSTVDFRAPATRKPSGAQLCCAIDRVRRNAKKTAAQFRTSE